MSGFRLERGGGTGPRAGVIETARGAIHTPAFMPVGTYGVVRTLTPEEVRGTGAEVMLANAYHLYLRPGIETVQELGGLHRFMGWDGPILTDSGGFQVFSMGHLRRLTDEGAVFRSHIDGSLHVYTPEKAMAVQEALGSDIVMPLDVCSTAEAGEGQALKEMTLTLQWLRRSVESYRGQGALFGICQGGMYPGLRRSAARALGDLDLDGSAVGGLSVGEPKARTWAMLEESVVELPADRPRYMMGVGSPEDLVEGVRRGVDIFDCVLATRLGRNGVAFTPQGRLSLRQSRWRLTDRPIEPGCDCYACSNFSLAYLHHLRRVGEQLVNRLASLHNLRFLVRLMGRLRAAILAGDFEGAARAFLEGYRAVEEERRLEGRQRYAAAMAGRAR